MIDNNRQCSACGRDFAPYENTVKPGSQCPSDDCPSATIKRRELKDFRTHVRSGAWATVWGGFEDAESVHLDVFSDAKGDLRSASLVLTRDKAVQLAEQLLAAVRAAKLD